MKASIAGRVRNTNLPKAKTLLPMFEAVINGFQGIEEFGAGNHRIDIIAERQGDLDDAKSGKIESFAISDTGIGFTDANYDSFNTVDSPYKASHGGKGLGRFLWLKAFQRVEIESHFRVSGSRRLLKRSFTFDLSDDERTSEPAPCPRTMPLTTVRLIGYRQPYRDECPRSLEVIAQRLVGHFLPLFLNPKGPTLILRDQIDTIDLRAFYRDNFEALATHHHFTVADQAFTLNGFRLHGAIADQHELVYGANYREVISERLSRFLPNLRHKLTDLGRGQFLYVAFVQSPFLDGKVNSERTDFSIPREPPAEQAEDESETLPATTDLLAEDINLKAIRDASLAAVGADLKPFLDEINTAKEAALTNYIAEEAPQYRVLLKYKGDFIDKIAPLASKTELEMALHRQLYDRQVILKREGVRILAEADNIQDSEEYYTRFQKFVEDEAYRMVREIREGTKKDKGGRYIRPANHNIPAYCYIICDLTPAVEIRIQNMGARRTPDNLGYYGFNETLKAYYEVISYNKLLSDAAKRNRVLFEKLNLPTSH